MNSKSSKSRVRKPSIDVNLIKTYYPESISPIITKLWDKLNQFNKITNDVDNKMILLHEKYESINVTITKLKHSMNCLLVTIKNGEKSMIVELLYPVGQLYSGLFLFDFIITEIERISEKFNENDSKIFDSNQLIKIKNVTKTNIYNSLIDDYLLQRRHILFKKYLNFKKKYEKISNKKDNENENENESLNSDVTIYIQSHQKSSIISHKSSGKYSFKDFEVEIDNENEEMSPRKNLANFYAADSNSGYNTLTQSLSDLNLSINSENSPIKRIHTINHSEKLSFYQQNSICYERNLDIRQKKPANPTKKTSVWSKVVSLSRKSNKKRLSFHNYELLNNNNDNEKLNFIELINNNQKWNEPLPKIDLNTLIDNDFNDFNTLLTNNNIMKLQEYFPAKKLRVKPIIKKVIPTTIAAPLTPVVSKIELDTGRSDDNPSAGKRRSNSLMNKQLEQEIDNNVNNNNNNNNNDNKPTIEIKSRKTKIDEPELQSPSIETEVGKDETNTKIKNSFSTIITPTSTSTSTSLFPSTSTSTINSSFIPKPIVKSEEMLKTEKLNKMNNQEKVTLLYQNCNADKLNEIPKLLTKYLNKENELISKLETKYKIKLIDLITIEPSELTQSQTQTQLQQPQTSIQHQPTTNTGSIFSATNKSIFNSPVKSTITSTTAAIPTIGSGLSSIASPGLNSIGFAPVNIMGSGFPASSFGQSQPQPQTVSQPVIGSQFQQSGVKVRPEIIVTEIYKHCNADKISEIPKLLNKYLNNETELISKLEKKYNVNVTTTNDGKVIVQQNNVIPAQTSIFGSQHKPMLSTSVFGSQNLQPQQPLQQTMQPTTSSFGSPFAHQTQQQSVSPFASSQQQSSPFNQSGFNQNPNQSNQMFGQSTQSIPHSTSLFQPTGQSTGASSLLRQPMPMGMGATMGMGASSLFNRPTTTTATTNQSPSGSVFGGGGFGSPAAGMSLFKK